MTFVQSLLGVPFLLIVHLSFDLLKYFAVMMVSDRKGILVGWKALLSSQSMFASSDWVISRLALREGIFFRSGIVGCTWSPREAPRTSHNPSAVGLESGALEYYYRRVCQLLVDFLRSLWHGAVFCDGPTHCQNLPWRDLVPFDSPALADEAHGKYDRFL